MSFPVFDLHCDTAYALLGKDFRQRIRLRSNKGHIDLDRASTLGGYAQCFACFTSPEDVIFADLTPQKLFALQYENILIQLEENRDCIRLAKSAADVRKNAADGYMSAILTIEGTAGFHYECSALDRLYDMGFRVSTLGWNERNCLAGSHATGGGLTDRGRAYVKKAQQLGMLIDVSHISDEAFWDILDITQKPIIASHSNSRSVHAVSRNLTDAMFLAICQAGGVVGMNLYTGLLGSDATVDTVCDHVFHFLDLDPAGKHIALGGDLDGCDSLPKGFHGVQSYTILADRLIARGVHTDTVSDIFWNNALGVIERCCT